MSRKEVQPLHIYRFLPRTNCKLCGCPTCYSFAFDLISRDRTLNDCPPLQEPEQADALKTLKGFLGEGERIPGTDHVIDRTRCTGCGDCVLACGRALTTVTIGGRLSKRETVPEVLQVINGSLHVINAPSCKRSDKSLDLCGVCADRCPFEALDLVKAEPRDDDD